MLLAVVQLLFMGAVLGAGLIHKVETPIPWEMLLRCVLGGWVACLPLAALQLESPQPGAALLLRWH